MKTAAESAHERIISNTHKINKVCEELLMSAASEFSHNLHDRNKILGILHDMQQCCAVPDFDKDTTDAEKAAVLSFVSLCRTLIGSLSTALHEQSRVSWTKKFSDIVNPLQGKRPKLQRVKPGVFSARARAIIKTLEPTFENIFSSIPQKSAPVLKSQAQKLVGLGKQLEAKVGADNKLAADALISFIILLYGIIAALRRNLK
jgi:hypothetical protein